MITPSGPGKNQPPSQAMATGIGGGLLLLSALGLHHGLAIRYAHIAIIMLIAVLASMATSGLVAHASSADGQDATEASLFQLLRSLLVIASAIISLTAILLMLR